MASPSAIEGYAPPPGQITSFVFGEASFVRATINLIRLSVPRGLEYRRIFAAWLYANGASKVAAIEGEIVFYRDGLIVNRLPMSNGQQITDFGLILGRSLVGWPGNINSTNQINSDTRDGLNLGQLASFTTGLGTSSVVIQEYLSPFYVIADCDEIVLNITSLSATSFIFTIPPTFFLGVNSVAENFSPEELIYA